MTIRFVLTNSFCVVTVVVVVLVAAIQVVDASMAITMVLRLEAGVVARP